MFNLFGVRKFVNEFLDEWPIVFMDDYRAKEWLTENKRPKQAVLSVTETKPAIEMMMSHTADVSELFYEIYGMDDIKELFKKAITSEKPFHILLVGPPACAKSSFLHDLLKLKGSYFTIGSTSTKSGMVDALFDIKPRYLIVDELEKMSVKDQTMLLSLMEGGIISETKYRRTRQTKLNTTIFAAANNTDNLLGPLLTRFCVLHLTPYSFEEFRQITINVLHEKEDIDSGTAALIADAVWNKMKSANIRDCFRIGRLAKTPYEVSQLVTTFAKYGSKS
jgi:MoxR-like ATPase